MENGAQIQAIYWPETEHSASKVKAENGRTLELSISNAGVWVNEIENGKLKRSHNAQLLETIVWAESP